VNTVERMIETKNPSNSTVVVGTARDISSYLPKTIEKMEMIGNLFQTQQYIIFENDSKDDTLHVLQQWEKNNSNVTIITETNVPGPRTQRLAYARNLLMKKALSMNSDYIVVMDLDDVNLDITKEAFLSSFEYNNWAVMTANQSEKMYDLWGLRTFDNWLEFDCWHCIKTENKSKDFCLYSRYKHIEKNHPLIKVKSAFGGLAIYNTSYLDPTINLYFGGTGEQEVCEHVSFHESINGNIYINPRMINSIGSTIK
jgi:glycosyltransferase involved in cell wall biosynthesis